MHIRKQNEHYFEKWIDLSIEYAIHMHDESLLMRVKGEWHIQKAKPYFSKMLRYIQFFSQKNINKSYKLDYIDC